MRKSILLGVIIGFVPVASFAQMASSGPAGPYPDIRNSDLGAHDSFSTPDTHDALLKQRERELSDRIQAERQGGGPSRPAKSSELSAGAPINDKKGIAIAKIDEVDADGVVVSSAIGKIKVPAGAFGHNRVGLLLDMTKAEFDQIVAKANAGS
ncbi:MAG TPA: hypothetical protein VF098_01535 [Sphingomicrobium sp.]